MMKHLKKRSLSLAQTSVFCLSLLAFSCVGKALAQGESINQNSPANQISMSIFPVERGADGQQYIITKAGYKVTVPGLGIAPNANEIAVYKDNANNYWYVDKNGATQKVTHDQLQWTLAQINQQQAQRNMMAGQSLSPQMMSQSQMPMGQPASQVVVQNLQPNPQGSSVGGTAMMSSMAAMGGAMAGSAMASSMYSNNSGYHGIPYGAPCYNEGGRSYYQGADGQKYPVPADERNPYLNQWNRQTAYAGNEMNSQNSNLGTNPYEKEKVREDGRRLERGVRDIERLVH